MVSPLGFDEAGTKADLSVSIVMHLIRSNTCRAVMRTTHGEHGSMIPKTRHTVDAVAMLSCLGIVAFQVALPAGVFCHPSDWSQSRKTHQSLPRPELVSQR